MKVLNLYAGIGGNRKLWRGVDVTAVEQDSRIAEIYKHFFPDDKVIIGDAHNYLLEHYQDFDFIWLSRPCTTHTRIRQMMGVGRRGVKPVYPDFGLYEEIVFLQNNARCSWVAENVNPYYEPLIKPTTRIKRHLFWSNFHIPAVVTVPRRNHEFARVGELESQIGFDLSPFKFPNKRQILRNCVAPELGNHILQAAKLSVERLAA